MEETSIPASKFPSHANSDARAALVAAFKQAPAVVAESTKPVNDDKARVESVLSAFRKKPSGEDEEDDDLAPGADLGDAPDVQSPAQGQDAPGPSRLTSMFRARTPESAASIPLAVTCNQIIDAVFADEGVGGERRATVGMVFEVDPFQAIDNSVREALQCLTNRFPDELIGLYERIWSQVLHDTIVATPRIRQTGTVGDAARKNAAVALKTQLERVVTKAEGFLGKGKVAGTEVFRDILVRAAETEVASREAETSLEPMNLNHLFADLFSRIGGERSVSQLVGHKRETLERALGEQLARHGAVRESIQKFGANPSWWTGKEGQASVDALSETTQAIGRLAQEGGTQVDLRGLGREFEATRAVLTDAKAKSGTVAEISKKIEDLSKTLDSMMKIFADMIASLLGRKKGMNP